MKYLTGLILLFLSTVGFTQLSTSNQPPASLVQNVLLGSGVTVSNITYNGSAAAIGYFTANVNNFGLTEGVVITTGTIANTGDGPQGPNNNSGAGMDNGAGGYAPLSSLVGNSTFNASVLEFDFVPYSDSIKFRYIFGSEEYLEYVGSTYNDIFAFFIAGPGFSGLQNIAKLPNGQTVAINNVHSATTNPYGTWPPQNSQFYVDNGNGSQSPYNSSSSYIQYDGFTKVLTAAAKVQCGQTYHLIIAIADVGDAFLDSGIFLEANSLSSKTPVDISYHISQELFGSPDIIAEGCVTTTVTLERGANEIASPMTIPINVSGTATEGVDYDNIPASITFPAGVSTVSFSFDAYQDGLVEGTETINLEFPLTDPCGNVTPIEINLSLKDVQPVDVIINGVDPECPGDPVTLTAIPSGGAPTYTYLWSTGENTQSITVSPTSNTTYSVQVTDACLNETASTDHEVVVPIIPPLILNPTPDITEICPYLPATLESNPSGGSGNYTYQWSSSFSSNLGNTPTIEVIPSTTTTYTINVTDNCGNTTSENIVYTITSPPLVLEMSPDIEICPGDSAYISVQASGGYGNYYYNWYHSGETTPGVWVYPRSSTTYTVNVSDECQTFSVEGSTTVTIVKPNADFNSSSTTYFNDLPITFVNWTQGATTYEWTFGDGNGSTITNPQNTYDEPGTYYVTLIAIDDKGCRDTITKPILIEEEWYLYIPNTFTPNGDRLNSTFQASTIGINTLSIQIYNRWGELVFTDDARDFQWDGTFDGAYVPDGTYTYKVEFVTNSGRDLKRVGHVNVLK